MSTPLRLGTDPEGWEGNSRGNNAAVRVFIASEHIGDVDGNERVKTES